MAKKAAQRAKGSGCLIKRGSLWTARWTVDGKTYVRTTGESDKRKAEKKLEQFVEPFGFKQDAEKLAAMATKIDGAEAQADALLPALTLLNTFTAYRASPNRPDSGERTTNEYEGKFNKLVDWLRDTHPEVRELRQVSKEIASEFAGHIGGLLTANTFNKYMVLMKCIWRVLADNPEARLKVNPWEGITTKRLVTHSRRELTIEELRRVIDASSGEMRLLLAIGIYSGLRLKDAALLQWSNVDMVKGVISVIPAKTARRTGKRITVPVHRTLYALLNECPEDMRTGYIMPTLAKRYLSFNGALATDVGRLFRSVKIDTTVTAATQGGGLRKAADCGFHSLRHSFVSLCASGGVPMAIVQNLIGHGSIAMTQHYFHVDGEQAKTAIGALPCFTGVDTPAPAADATQSGFDAILEGLEKLTAGQLKKVVSRCKEIIKKGGTK